MRVLVCGDRNWINQGLISRTLDAYLDQYYRSRQDNGAIFTVIEGEARGADTCGRYWAESNGIPFLPYPAKWKEYGKAAGPIRNQQMLTEGKPDLVLAFHNSLETSKGTKDMVNRARKAGIRVEVITENV